MATAADEDEVMPSAGVSVATAQGYASTTKLFDVFRNSNEERAERFPSLFGELDEEKVREMDTYARFTYFISYTYIIPEGTATRASTPRVASYSHTPIG